MSVLGQIMSSESPVRIQKVFNRKKNARLNKATQVNLTLIDLR